ncbi:TPA: FliC/FljB family flagellin [Escherichia coli]|uniref:FliC/FljB family flagellin n=1 Tax=Enterobacteriaceae TaxID=543 RepID=UPI0017B1830B|nr:MULTISPECIES: FliC/FljB family flagellin [Enterobacteriaceae]EFE4491927.1 FliC/FljB family flagellin [Escherichia coli]EFO1619075.1 FliC/FljB family flagellin [Escherichia coli]EHC5019453.1 FliC/FljB family flagellin [Escherichia coli]MBK2821874.1 FliC/FljB family flagellin [Enterobacter hormaechei]HCS8441237.1 FliC/FljB family flagellin [Escherichia coli]
MAQVINTNSLSLITQNNINKNQSSMSTAIERLSSGLRINSAKDDAAGQAIANRFTSNIKGLTQAARNANDGISVAQTTEGALSEINNNLQRIRELTVQSSTGTNSKSDLDSIQDEIKSRLDEIDRVSGQTQFNGVNVLAKDGSMKIQVGANDGQTITIDLKKIDSSTLNLTGFNVNGEGSVANKAATKADLTAAQLTTTAAGTNIPAPAADANGVTKYTVSAGLKESTVADVFAGLSKGDKIVETSLKNGFDTVTAGEYTYNKDTNDFTFNATIAAGSATVDNSPKLQSFLTPKAGDTANLNVQIGTKSLDVVLSSDGKITAKDGSELFIGIDGNLTQNNSGTGIKPATLDALTKNTTTPAAAVPVTITTEDKTKIVLAGATTANQAGAITVTGARISADALQSATKTTGFTIGSGATQTVVAANSGKVTIGGTTAQAYTQTDGKLDTGNETSIFLQKDGSITNGSGKAVYVQEDGKFTTDAATKAATTTDPLKALDDAISSIDKFRSSLGAVQNRLDSAVTNLNNTTTNLSEAQSRIQDADYATEVSNMSKAQIIQQAGNSVLAKANQVPQQVLSLLQG